MRAGLVVSVLVRFIGVIKKLMRTVLNFISAFVVAVCIVVAILFIILYATGTVHYVLDPLDTFFERARVGQLVGLSSESSALPPTWTPRVTFVPTVVSSGTPTVASSDLPLSTPSIAVVATDSSETNDDNATLVSEEFPSPTPSLSATEPPMPTSSSQAYPTPEPLYVLEDLLGGPDCDYVGFSGTVWDVEGAGHEGVRIELFNDAQYKRSVLTDQNGLYELIIDTSPQSHLEGNWHIRVLENKVQVSNEIIVVMSSTCEEDDLTRFVANFKRTQ